MSHTSPAARAALAAAAVAATHTPQLRDTLTALSTVAERALMRRYGTCANPRRGYGYHNYDHGRDVAAAARQLATVLAEARRVPEETIYLAEYAGWCHDLEQGPGHEQRSARYAAYALRRHGVPQQHVATVTAMIEATRVVGVDGHRLVQAADPDDPRQAILADADLSSLGSRHGVYRALLLCLEQQHLSGLITLPADPHHAEPDREAAVRFLSLQVGLFREHRYLLDISRRMFPHAQRNADAMEQLVQLYVNDRITYPDMLARARDLLACPQQP